MVRASVREHNLSFSECMNARIDAKSYCMYNLLIAPACNCTLGIARYLTFNIGISMKGALSMGCPPARGDNPRALASGLSHVQMDESGITILYHLHQCRPCTSRDILCLSW